MNKRTFLKALVAAPLAAKTALNAKPALPVPPPHETATGAMIKAQAIQWEVQPFHIYNREVIVDPTCPEDAIYFIATGDGTHGVVKC